MAKRELSSTLRSLKFMQRAAQKEETTKKEEEVKPDTNGTVKKRCVVIMEGDPHPGATIWRMSFQSFNPSIDLSMQDRSSGLRIHLPLTIHLLCSAGLCCHVKVTPFSWYKLNEQPANIGQPDSSGGGTLSRENGASLDEECSKADTEDCKRKQSSVASEPQYPSKSQKIIKVFNHHQAPAKPPHISNENARSLIGIPLDHQGPKKGERLH